MILVIDASVVVKLVVEETGSEAAMAAVSTGEELVAPNFMLIETANALRKKRRAGEITESEARSAFRDILTMPVTRIEESGDLVADALELALALRHPVQDCIYLALALRRNGRVMTADRAFADAVRARPEHADRVRLLGEAA